MSNTHPKISIIINNYNYGRFISQAIESALNQTFQPHEIVVVDDGSSDDSVEIIKRYGSKIIPVLKQNGGQGSAFNAGFKKSSGDWIWFLDADDWLEINALQAIAEFARQDISKIHAPLRASDETGTSLHFTVPSKPLSEGNVIPEIIKEGGYCWPPTSGNAFPRWVLEGCMPIPENEYRLCADLYICCHAAMFGKVHALREPVGFYRIHAANLFHGFRMDSKWLDDQAKNLITAATLIEDLVRKHGYDHSFNYRDSRRNVEMLMIAKRFSVSGPASQFSKKTLDTKWWNSAEVRNISGIARFKAIVFWIILTYAPKPLARYLVNIRQRKSQRNIQSHDLVSVNQYLNK